MGIYTPKACAVVSFMYGDKKKTAVQFFVKSCTVEKKMYKEAGKFTIVADYQYFPFDPRIVLSPLVSIHMDNVVDSNDFTPNQQNLVFIGYVDSITPNAKKCEVTFKGIDYSGLFLNTKAAFTLPAIGQPITEIFSQIKTLIPAAANIKILYKPNNDIPIVSQAVGNLKTTATLSQSVEKDSNAWDFFQSLAQSVGLICYMDLDTIVLDDPTHFRMDLENDSYCFGYPTNTTEISMERKNGKYNSLQIELRSTQGKQVLIAQYPENPIQAYHLSAKVKEESVQTGLSVVQHKINKIVQTVSGNTNINTLKLMAQRVYNELQMYQSTVKVHTKDMDVFTKNSASSQTKIPIFNIKIAENVNIINFWDEYSSSQSLEAKGWDSIVAQELSQLQANAQRLFYISEISFNFSNTQGISSTISGLSRLNLNGEAQQNNF